MAKTGIQTLGYIKNIKTFVAELQSLLVGTAQTATQAIVDKAIDEQTVNGGLRYLNKFGYSSDRDGSNLTEKNSAYMVFETEYKNKDGESILGWLYRQRLDQNFTGVSFGTEKDLKEEIKDKTLFRMGDLMFDIWSDAYDFLDDVANNTISEKWTYRYHSSGIPHPILKAYIENIFEKLTKEPGKIMKSDDQKHIIFNSNLLDKYFHEIFIIAEVVIDEEETTYRNPFRLKGLTECIFRDVDPPTIDPLFRDADPPISRKFLAH